MKDSLEQINQLSPEQRRLLLLKLKGRAPKISQADTISRRADYSPVVTSCNQEWLWSIDSLTGGNPSWNVFTGGAFSGHLDVGLLERSLNEIIRRHEILRTTFSQAEGQPMQVIAPSLRLELPLVDLRGTSPELRASEARRLITESYRQIFDLSTGPLIRPTLFRLEDEEYQLFVAMHHTVTDWVSFILLNKELAAIYQAFEAGQPSPLAELPIQYADFALWEREWIKGEAAAAQLEYWRHQLKGAPLSTTLPTARLRPPIQGFRGARQPMSFTAEVAASLRRLTQQEGVTLFITLLAALKALLYLYTKQEDILIGTPVVGRKPPQTQKLIGIFLNHLALRTSLSGELTYRQLVGRVRRTVLDGYTHQDLPFGALVKELLPARDLSRMPFFQVMFFFLTVPAAQAFSSISLRDFEAYGETARYDLLVTVWDRAQTLKGVIEYNLDLFDSRAVERMARNFELLVSTIVADPDQPLSTQLAQLV